jgi:hypothetical protein
MKQYLITTASGKTMSRYANCVTEATSDTQCFYKDDNIVSVRLQKVKEYTMDVMEIGLEDETSIPMKGQFDGTFGSGGQFRGIHFDIDTTALKVMGKKKKQTITIVCEITDVSSKKQKSWNMNVREVE